MIRELLAILWDALAGSRCGTCGERWKNLSAHRHWDHFGEDEAA